MRTSRIIGTGSCLPKQAATNDYLATFLDTSDEWIRERTGISERRISNNEEEFTNPLAAAASLRAIENSGISASDIDLILFATISPDMMMPNSACSVQKCIGAPAALCFDINAACSGFLFALQTAHAYISSGMASCALVIGAETLSRTVDWTDRGTCILFGDGAGACILKASDTGILDFESGCDGSRGEVLSLGNRGLYNPYHKGGSISSYIKMDGQEVFKFAVRKVPESILNLLERNHMGVQEVEHYILHQANKRILQAVAKRLGVSEERFPMNLNLYGNTSAASVPILLDELNRAGELQKGETLVLSGFGGGLTWGNVLMKW